MVCHTTMHINVSISSLRYLCFFSTNSVTNERYAYPQYKRVSKIPVEDARQVDNRPKTT